MTMDTRGQATGYRILSVIFTAMSVAGVGLVAYGLYGARGPAYRAAAAQTTTPSYGGLYLLVGLSMLVVLCLAMVATWHAVERSRGGVDA